AASWLSSSDVIAFFLQELGSSVCLRPRAFQVIAEHLPAYLNVSSTEALRQIEQESLLPANTIRSVRWIKPVSRRSASQQTAFAIATFASPEEANDVIREGFVIKGRTVRTRKLPKEPRRCLKCQRWNVNHSAANCKADKETCAKCSENHRSGDCTITDPALFRCPNCKNSGHEAWSHSCPKYQEELRKVNDQNPDNNYKYFPTADPSTWVLID
ncbi:hypothetical protein SCHPADRAFT_803297, partial [Schizopora paradoxa]